MRFAIQDLNTSLNQGAGGLGIIRGNKVETVMLNSHCNNDDKKY